MCLVFLHKLYIVSNFERKKVQEVLSVAEQTGLLLGIIFFLLFITMAIYSKLEREPLAFRRSLYAAFLLPLPFLILALLHTSWSQIAVTLLDAVTITAIIVLLLPIYPEKKKIHMPDPVGRIDERNVMFSRAELTPGTENFKNYYTEFPQHLPLDDKFRSNPGLLSSNASKYDPITFAVAEANFTTVAYFKHNVTGKVSDKKLNTDPHEITSFIKSWAKRLGAHAIGITYLRDYHLYTMRGRNYNYGQPVINTHKYAIAIIVEMNKEMIDAAPDGPTIMESSQQYLTAGTLAMQIAQFIRNIGYDARAHIDGNYEVICPLVARDAGLGEIGRMGLLMTPKLGPRVRISVVTTDLPLTVDHKPDYSWMTTFCNICKKCAYNCPSKAISTQPPRLVNGIRRWQINQEKCFTYWTRIGTDCARCISVCPFAHPDNLLHNTIRLFIRHSYLFARFALLMDNIFYGHHPRPRWPHWIPRIKK